jgi:hypothetical protein
MNQRRFLGLGISILGVLIVSPALFGQVSKESEAGFPTDWSSHHLIFSKPATAEQARRVQQDPRYWQQIARRAPAAVQEPEIGGGLVPELQLDSRAGSGESPKINKDWRRSLGPGGTVGAGNYPAKFSFQITSANCAGAAQPDFVVFGTGVLGSSSQATIVAEDNLYSGCSGSGTVPSFYWSYNTGGTVNTSPVLSLKGTSIAFVQLGGGHPSTLVLLKWAESGRNTSSPVTLTSQTTAADYFSCAAPCMITLPLQISGAAQADTYSSVFYDYGLDTAYVGDNAGYLHKFHPVFYGPPAEVAAGGWPVQVNPSAPTALTSPVYDFTLGYVYVADNGGFLYRVDSTGHVTKSGQLDVSDEFDSGPGIVQGPIVDSTAGYVYAFATSDGSKSCTGGSDCPAVYELPANFTAGSKGSEAVAGASTVEPTQPNPMYIGALDSTYENSVNGTGNIYVCGNTGGPPILYQIPVAAGVFGTVTPGPVISNDTTPCSPVADILNPNVPLASGGATEWMFASAVNGGISSGCAGGGCVFNFKDTPWQPSTNYAIGQEVVDSHFQIHAVSTPGTSGAAPPTWATTAGNPTVDGTVIWVDQGVHSAITLAAWAADTAYTVGDLILDSNDNIELCDSTSAPGTSGGTAPAWNTTPGGSTGDGFVGWENVGAIATAALAEAGGTSGIIIDNTVSPSTLAGTSDIYFSTLSGCLGPSHVDGCAVQTSQALP